MSETPVSDNLQWKREYLALSDTIEDFQKKRLAGIEDFQPPVEDLSQGNISKLLNYHLDRCKELMWAQVNGGLDNHYQAEVDALKDF